MEGSFITFEGIEGTGKSTLSRFLAETLQQRGLSTYLTREPGGTPLAEEIRELLLQKRDESVSAIAELLLVFAARSQHIEEVIKPRLGAGETVICDRFTDATYAYQGAGRGMDEDFIRQLETGVQGHLRPDLTILLTVDPQLGLDRARKTGEPDRFEQEKKAFYVKVQNGYLRLAEAEPERFIVLDSERELDQVKTLMLQQLLPRLKN